jgi:hypothetical protein
MTNSMPTENKSIPCEHCDGEGQAVYFVPPEMEGKYHGTAAKMLPAPGSRSRTGGSSSASCPGSRQRIGWPHLNCGLA